MTQDKGYGYTNCQYCGTSLKGGHQCAQAPQDANPDELYPHSTQHHWALGNHQHWANIINQIEDDCIPDDREWINTNSELAYVSPEGEDYTWLKTHKLVTQAIWITPRFDDDRKYIGATLHLDDDPNSPFNSTTLNTYTKVLTTHYGTPTCDSTGETVTTEMPQDICDMINDEILRMYANKYADDWNKLDQLKQRDETTQ